MLLKRIAELTAESDEHRLLVDQLKASKVQQMLVHSAKIELANQRSERTESQLEHMALRFNSLSSKAEEMRKRLKNDGIPLQHKDSLKLAALEVSIERLVVDNTSLFNKISKERMDYEGIIVDLKAKIDQQNEVIGDLHRLFLNDSQPSINLIDKGRDHYQETSTDQSIKIQNIGEKSEHATPFLPTGKSIAQSSMEMNNCSAKEETKAGVLDKSTNLVKEKESLVSTKESLKVTPEFKQTPLDFSSATKIILGREDCSGDKPILQEFLGKQKAHSVTPHLEGTRPNFAYQQVVRDKETRKQMHGEACPCCADYYRLTANLRPLPELGVNPEDAESLMQKNSRHRVWSKRPDTPPGFWRTDFPTSQELLEAKVEKKQRRSS